MKANGVFSVVLVVVIATAGCGRLLGKREVTSVEFLSEVAAEVNKECPKQIDEETELTRVEAVEGVLVYQYRLVNYPKAEVDPSQILMIMPQVMKQVCAESGTRDLLAEGVSLRYSYNGRSGEFINHFEINPVDCGL